MIAGRRASAATEPGLQALSGTFYVRREAQSCKTAPFRGRLSFVPTPRSQFLLELEPRLGGGLEGRRHRCLLRRCLLRRCLLRRCLLRRCLLRR